jgi:hypothetical protein
VDGGERREERGRCRIWWRGRWGTVKAVKASGARIKNGIKAQGADPWTWWWAAGWRTVGVGRGSWSWWSWWSRLGWKGHHMHAANGRIAQWVDALSFINPHWPACDPPLDSPDRPWSTPTPAKTVDVSLTSTSISRHIAPGGHGCRGLLPRGRALAFQEPSYM